MARWLLDTAAIRGRILGRAVLCAVDDISPVSGKAIAARSPTTIDGIEITNEMNVAVLRTTTRRAERSQREPSLTPHESALNSRMANAGPFNSCGVSTLALP